MVCRTGSVCAPPSACLIDPALSDGDLMHRRNCLLAGLTGLLPVARATEPSCLRISTLPDNDLYSDTAGLILTRAYSRLGIAMDVSFMPGERSLVSANSGKSDGELYRRSGIEQTYRNLILVPHPLMMMKIAAFSSKIKVPIRKFSDLKPFRIDFVRGLKIIEESSRGMQATALPTMHHAFMKMAVGRTDIVVGNLATGLTEVSRYNIQGVLVNLPPLFNFPVFHFLHSRNAALVPRVGAQLMQMEINGELESIRREMAGKLLAKALLPTGFEIF